MTGVWVAGLPYSQRRTLPGRLCRLGGTLRLEDEELVFEPIGGIGRTRRLPLRQIVAVRAFADSPPRLSIETADGRGLVLMIAANRLTPVWTRDTSTRDRAVAAISRHVGLT
ncbi:hypothetical protein CFN78_17815 [Amycolatopsis antarctica]|uniref:PH domain-containing protein n=1 Tax=Amycolatopsis antarctica TaxID=1854586 RepID=A0A263D0N5_9PSEU|nr:hypothetical protein [Amycolatopsis antarctica]OZM71992.1 hypothetical protein CFN78_17815 [Amycolatopsis antarctica]